MNVFFGFAFAHGMIAGRESSRLVVTKLTAEQAAEQIEAAKAAEILVPALNPSHTATVEAMTSRFGISMPIPERAPMVSLSEGDQVHYTNEEIAGATFEFALYELLPSKIESSPETEGIVEALQTALQWNGLTNWRPTTFDQSAMIRRLIAGETIVTERRQYEALVGMLGAISLINSGIDPTMFMTGEQKQLFYNLSK